MPKCGIKWQLFSSPLISLPWNLTNHPRWMLNFTRWAVRQTNCRLYSTIESSLNQFRLPNKPLDIAQALLPRSLLAVHGPDSAKFLNGLITTRPPEYTGLNSPQPLLNEGIGCYTSMLNAKGRVISDMFVYPAHDNSVIKESIKTNAASVYVLDVDTKILEKVLSTLDFHVLAADVQITSLQGQFSVIHAWNDLDELDINSISGSTVLWTVDKRASGLGMRAVVQSGTALPQLEIAPLEQYQLRRYLFGIPEGVDEIKPNKALPLDYCIDYMGGVDFNKGCYLGQELTIRTHHHGNVRKRVMPVIFAGTKDEPISDDIYKPVQFDIEQDANITDDSPVPNTDTLTPIFGSSPFGSSSSVSARQRPSGSVIASLGNVGLAKLRVDTTGHEFRVGDTYVRPMTPFWWP